MRSTALLLRESLCSLLLSLESGLFFGLPLRFVVRLLLLATLGFVLCSFLLVCLSLSLGLSVCFLLGEFGESFLFILLIFFLDSVETVVL